MNNELLEALNILEQEKNISKDTLLEAIENSLVTACKNNFGKSDNVKVVIDPETCEFHCYQEKTVVENVEELHTFLYPKDEYTASQTVMDIASEVEILSGYTREDYQSTGDVSTSSE